MNSPNMFLDIWNFNSTSLFWFFEMDLLKMALIILSDSNAVIPYFLEETLRTCVLVSWTQDFFKLKYVISGFTVDLRLVEPFGVYALIFLAQNNFVRFGWYLVTRGSPKLVFAAITRSNFRSKKPCNSKLALILELVLYIRNFEEFNTSLLRFAISSILLRTWDEHAPIKTMRVRGQDVSYMKTKWKNALRAKRKAEARYRQKKTA